MDDPQFWQAASDIVAKNDPHIQGIIILGKNMPSGDLASVFKAGRSADRVNGFAIGRTIFGDVAANWFTEKMTDEEAMTEMSQRFSSLIQMWDDVGEKM